jgi:hypothetical protein
MRAKVIVAAALLLGLVAWDFVAATTFVGDDYLFLAFARLEPNPLVAFVHDMHGGEYYRPVPMLLWWLLDRAGQGATWPFALAGFLLHAGSAALVVALGRGVGVTLRVALAAGALFLVAPAQREAALWFAASTDLLATLATLAALVCLLRQSLKWEPWKGSLRPSAPHPPPPPRSLRSASPSLPRWCAASNEGAREARGVGRVAVGPEAPEGGARRLPTRLGWRAASVALAALAYFSKETALVLPLLAVAAEWAASSRQLPVAESTGRRGEGTGFLRTCVVPVFPHLAVAGGYLIVRFLVLHGLGGTNDPVAPWWGRALQMAAGLVHAVTAYAPLPEAVAWLVGGGLLLMVGVFAVRARAWFPVLWTLLALLPLPAAGWVVGARYFYLPAVGLMLMLALAADGRGTAAVIATISLLAAIGLSSTATRMGEVRHYRAVMAATRDAVAKGAQAGHSIFLVRNAVKDLDLAIKLTSPAERLPRPLLVIPDVPASFVLMPDVLADRARFLLARPPLPPAGEYHFGGQHIVGLARREEAPDLDEVLARLPELRFIELVTDGHGQISGKDRTESRP